MKQLTVSVRDERRQSPLINEQLPQAVNFSPIFP
jgi:hypothetical protein